MKPRYSLRRTLYRDAPRADQVRMCGATAQKIRTSGQESVFVGGNDEWGNGVRVGQSVTPALAPQAVAPLQSNSAGPNSTSAPLQDQQASLREMCRGERERLSSMVLERNVKIPTAMARSPPTDPGIGPAGLLGNWVKPPVRSLARSTHLDNNAGQGQGATENSTNPAMDSTTLAPALRTPGFSPSSVGGDDQVSLAPTAATLPPSTPSQARPFSRSPAEQITANSSLLNMSENSAATVLQRRVPPSASTFHFASPTTPSLVSGPLPGGDYQQSLERDQLPTELEGQKIPKPAERSVAACRQDPFSMQSIGTLTSPRGPLTPTRPATHDASTSPINFLTGAASTTGTSDPPSRTSAMEFIDNAALSVLAPIMLSPLLPSPKTPHERLLDPSDSNTDADDESEASSVLGEGDTKGRPIARDHCLTGRPRRVNQEGNERSGGYGNWRRGGYRNYGRDRCDAYGSNWD